MEKQVELEKERNGDEKGGGFCGNGGFGGGYSSIRHRGRRRG